QARGPAAKHLGTAEKGTDVLVLGVEVCVEGLGPEKHPAARVEIVRKHGARERLGQMDVRIDESGGHTEARAIDDAIEAAAVVAGENARARPDVADAIVVDDERRVLND